MRSTDAHIGGGGCEIKRKSGAPGSPWVKRRREVVMAVAQ